MHKPSVAHMVQHLVPGGIETMALDMIGSDENRYVISLEGTLDEALRGWPRLEAYRDRLIFMQKRPGLDINLPARLAATLKSAQFDAIHTHHVGPLLYGGLAAILAGISVRVHTEHDAWHLDNPKRRRLQRWTLRVVNPDFVADTDAVANAVMTYIPGQPVRIITNGIDTAKFTKRSQKIARKQLGLPAEKKIVGCAARLEEVKGHTFLIEAMGALPDTVHLALAGDGSLKADLHSQVVEAGLVERVHFLGAVDDMPTFYNALDVFCLPSLNEGMPLSPLEAQASGVPVVVTNVGGTASSVCPLTGILVPAKDSEALASGLSSSLGAKYKDAPRAFVEECADLRATLGAYEKLYTVKDLSHA